jgi:hypothetical protein
VIPAPASYIAVLGSAPLSAQRTLKAQDAKAKLEQMGLYQIKKLLHSKTINRVKTQPIEWEKIFARYSSDRINI